MSTRLTLFTATLVQDSALSVSGLDREHSTDQPFAVVDGIPTLPGRGLKGAAVAMARRFFDPLPRSISEDPERNSACRRSAWEFANTTPVESRTTPCLRAGVGIRHKTGARAGGILYDREVVPASTRWPLVFRVNWSHAGPEAIEAEGILGYVLARHWAAGRCWLGGGVARGLGWCHIEDLQAFRLSVAHYDRWVESGRKTLPAALAEIPAVEPTRSWCFHTLDLKISFGEYRPEANESSWGLDMLAVGPHDSERATQPSGSGVWVRPSWADNSAPVPDAVATDRAIAMEGEQPLLPGSSVRGPMRHAFSRAKTATGQVVQDPHPVQGRVSPSDPGGQVFGSVSNSSRVLIRDGRAEGDWFGARLHMHAEDEFSAGSFGSAKRDAVRMLRGAFPVRIVVEGPDRDCVQPLITEIDRLVALGKIGHLPVGGHKTRGAGWGRWLPEPWVVDDVLALRQWTPPADEEAILPNKAASLLGQQKAPAYSGDPRENQQPVWIKVSKGLLDASPLTLGETARLARAALGPHTLVAWWCEPTIDLSRSVPPSVFGRQWPEDESVQVDEVAFYAEGAVWRAARTVSGPQWIVIEETLGSEPDADQAMVVHTPAHLHGSSRFAAAGTGKGRILLREWHVKGNLRGFTLEKEAR